MSSEAAQQVLDEAVEMSGLSVVTATKTNDNPRRGTIYRPDILAAARPVHFHPLNDGRYLGLFAERWHTATIGTGGPQVYSAHTADETPFQATIDPVTGNAEDIKELPTRLSGERFLVSAFSRPPYLFVLGQLEDAPLIQHFRTDALGQLILQAEEVLPVVIGEADVTLADGIYIDNMELVVIGEADGQLYRARKSWGRIGHGTDPNRQWSYYGEKGWSPDPDDLAPLAGIDGVSVGPTVTSTTFRDRRYLAVSEIGTATTFYSARHVDATWRNEGTVATDYLYLQPQLRYNQAFVPEGKRAGIPYVRTEADSQSLQVAWGIFPV